MICLLHLNRSIHVRENGQLGRPTTWASLSVVDRQLLRFSSSVHPSPDSHAHWYSDPYDNLVLLCAILITKIGFELNAKRPFVRTNTLGIGVRINLHSALKRIIWGWFRCSY